MATLPELTRLFAQLATNLRRSNASPAINPVDGDDLSDETSNAVSSLAASLNSQTPRSGVLDAVLSLMCFDAPQVVGARIECLVSTIVSVLSSMASCSVSRLGRGDLELIRVGSSISFRDCGELIRIGADVLENLEAHSGASPKTVGLSHTLLHAILRAAVSSSNCQMFSPSTSILIEKHEQINVGRRAAITKLICFLPDEASVRSDGIPLRLYLWYLDPLILKHDISEMLRETIQRPFLCLKEELYARMSWRSAIICFVTSPTMFLETRALMHSWFLLTGLASILNFQIAVISSVLDVLSQPMVWGVSMEMGLKFPPSYAYFPKKHHELLYILTGPVSCESFLNLVHHIRIAVTPTSKYSSQQIFFASSGISGHGSTENAVNINNSTWSMLMGFPAWFYFAAILIFHGKNSQDSCLSKAIFSAAEADTENVKELHKAAALYLSWVLNPLDKTCFDLLFDHIQESSGSWNTKSGANFSKEQFSSSVTRERKTHTRGRKLRISKVNDFEKSHLATNDSALALEAWLKEFDGSCVKVCSRAVITQVSTEATQGEHNANVQPNLLLLRIPLGILMMSSFLGERGCELLLHYATTGEILQSREMPKNTLGCLSQNLPLQFGSNGRTWPINGACLVFNLFDILEDMALLLFVCEDTRANFLCQMKGRVSVYLLRCIKRLLEFPAEFFKFDEVRERAMVDLYRRLTQWMQKGSQVFEGDRAFEETVDDFARKFTIGKD